MLNINKKYMFEINNHHWTITEMPKDEIKAALCKLSNEEYTYVFGYCHYANQTI